MEKEIKTEEYSKEKMMCKKHHHGHGGTVSNGSPIYCLSVIGAMFYFLQGASTFKEIIFGIGKSFAWPALLMFKLLSYLKM
jgi:hypothetical protein